jgi:HlyD family secretion protein
VEAQNNLRTAQAQTRVKKSELDYAEKQYKRSAQLVKSGAVSGQEADVDLARAESARAALIGVQAQVVASQSTIDAQTAEMERIKALLADNTLRSPIRARVQARLAQPGEVVAAGGKVLSTLDLSDVFMYVFLPTNVTGKLALGADARIVLDALPGFPVKAVVSYISPNAQFTPKTVETAEERHNLTFRVKLQIPDKEKLRAYERMVKVGTPGMGYVQLDPNAEWPKNLHLRPPSEWPKLPEIASGTTGSKQ